MPWRRSMMPMPALMCACLLTACSGSGRSVDLPTLDARLAAPVTVRPLPAGETLTADQVENGWARDRAELYQCAADKAAIVDGYRRLQLLASGGR